MGADGRPSLMACPACAGEGCPECGPNGEFEVPPCPKRFVTNDVWQALGYARLYAKGSPPVAGGALDQTRVFTDACAFVWFEQDRWQAEALKKVKR